MREQKFHIYLDSHERTILLPVAAVPGSRYAGHDPWPAGENLCLYACHCGRGEDHRFW